MDPTQTPHGRIAFEFAQALVAGDFDQAHGMLSSMAGEGESEAVTVVVSAEGGRRLTRSIEWGRP
jgi:hypothetical protein